MVSSIQDMLLAQCLNIYNPRSRHLAKRWLHAQEPQIRERLGVIVSVDADRALVGDTITTHPSSCWSFSVSIHWFSDKPQRPELGDPVRIVYEDNVIGLITLLVEKVNTYTSEYYPANQGSVPERVRTIDEDFRQPKRYSMSSVVKPELTRVITDKFQPPEAEFPGCHLELRLLDPDDVCPQCQHKASQHRQHPSNRGARS